MGSVRSRTVAGCIRRRVPDGVKTRTGVIPEHPERRQAAFRVLRPAQSLRRLEHAIRLVVARAGALLPVARVVRDNPSRLTQF